MSTQPTPLDPDTPEDLETLFNPQSVAVVGASANQQGAGYEFVQGLVEIGFPGPIYPVNPKLGDELLGRKAYARLEDVPGTVDFVISAVPASATPELVEGARVKGAKLIHLYTARFSETGRTEAAELEEELRRQTREAGIRVIGPNCMGVYYPKAKLTFSSRLPARPGNVGFLSQSGSHAFRVIGRGAERGLRFSKVVSYGNALDLTDADFLEHLADDPDTVAIGAYIEGLRDGRRFFEALRHAAARKPVVVMKGGRSAAGHAAASSHTAALASRMAIWRGALRQAGALEVPTINELIDMLVAFTNAGPIHGNRVAVLGGAGGETVESADLCQEAGLELPPLPEEMREGLREEIPHAWDWVGNPVDGSILGFGRNQAFAIVELMAASRSFDGVIANVRGLERALTRDKTGKTFREMLDRAKRLSGESEKAVMLVLGEPESREEEIWKAGLEARHELTAAGVAIYPDLERATRAMGRYAHYMAARRARGAA